jgi:hypothetical protein
MINATGVNTKGTKAKKKSRKGYCETPRLQVSVSLGFNFVTFVLTPVRQNTNRVIWRFNREITKSPDHEINFIVSRR